MVTHDDQPHAPLRIGELARRAGVTSRTVRHYHVYGLLPEPDRDASGHRRYDVADLARLIEIGRLRASGQPIDRIVALLIDFPPSTAIVPSDTGSLDAQPAQVAAEDTVDGWSTTDG